MRRRSTRNDTTPPAPSAPPASRRIIAAATVVAFTVVSIFAFIAVHSTAPGVPLSSPNNQQISSAMKALERCIPTTNLTEDTCLTAAMTAAALRDGPGAVAVAVQRLIPRDPVIGAACHTSGHNMGRVLYETMQTLDTLAAVGPSCVGAYLHGIFDAIGDTNPTEAEYQEAGRACNRLPVDAHNLCFDGLGHSLWRTTQSPEAVSTVCAVAETDPGRYGCLEGVQMQRYAPKIGTATDDVTKVSETLAPFCAALPEWSPAATSGLRIIVPCLAGGVYPFMVLHIGPVLYQLSSGPVLTDPAVLAEPYGKYLAACDSLRIDDTDEIAEIVTSCRSRIGWTTYTTYPDRNGIVAERVCTAFLRDLEQKNCLNQLNQLKKSS